MLYSLARPLLFSLDPETAHNVALSIARFSLPQKAPAAPVRVMGIDFPNPVGAAAGIDKHAEHVDAVAAMGFGFIELGGVTPRPQPGNPRPRLFRLLPARGIINRFGLNSIGVEAFVHNLLRARTRAVIGVNIGKNGDTPNERAAQDYELCLEKLYAHVHYLTINVSSPNTKGLRDLQSEAMLSAILKAMRDKRERLRERHGRNVALVVKISPDGDDEGLRIIADVTRRERADGIVATNTTVSREGVEALPQAKEEGGLSGAPLFRRSTEVLGRLAQLLKGEIPLIGCGGIMSGADARAKFDAGASLVQIYSGLVFRGPRLIPECVSACQGKDAGRACTPP
jgi:dihydroorotate dehydrogenase